MRRSQCNEKSIFFSLVIHWVLASVFLNIACSNSPSSIFDNKEVQSVEIETKRERTISLRADYWFPFNGRPDDKQPGFVVELAREIFREAGYSINYDILPWSRAISSVRAAKFDALVGAFKSDVPDFIFPDNEQGLSKTIFMVKKDSKWRYDGLSSLAQIRLGAVQDYGYGTALDNYIQSNKYNANLVDLISGQEVIKRNLNRLKMGRIDAIIDVEAVLKHTIKAEGWSEYFIKAGIASEDKVYIAFSPNNPKSKMYAKILSEGMLKLRHSGRYKTILEQYEID